MSFQVILYNNSSATNVVDKELSQVQTFSGTLRKGTSILDPAILIYSATGDFPTDSNYMYIAEFGRYYYITDIVSLYNNLWEVHCHVDVLKTYADGIRQQSAVVARQERTYNLMLDDGFFMSYQNPKIQIKLFSVEDPFENQEFVLIVAGS